MTDPAPPGQDQALNLARQIAAVVAELVPDPSPVPNTAAAAAHYDDDCEGYDLTNKSGLYLSPQRLAKLLSMQLTDHSAPILDVACGTGLLGQALAGHGFTNLTGTDVSARMLAAARQKSVYRQLLQLDLHQPLPLPPAAFAAVACAGAFYDGIVHVSALAQLLPLVSPGGVLACDVESFAWADGGFRVVLERLRLDGVLDLLEIAQGRMFAAGYLGDDGDDRALTGVFVLARRAALTGFH